MFPLHTRGFAFLSILSFNILNAFQKYHFLVYYSIYFLYAKEKSINDAYLLTLIVFVLIAGITLVTVPSEFIFLVSACSAGITFTLDAGITFL